MHLLTNITNDVMHTAKSNIANVFVHTFSLGVTTLSYGAYERISFLIKQYISRKIPKLS